MNHGLTEATVIKICAVLSRHAEVEQAILYGSRAKGNFKTGSDIDLTLVGNNLGENTRGLINFELDDLLLPYTIDLSLFSSLSHPGLIDHIQRIGTVFYEKKTAV